MLLESLLPSFTDVKEGRRNEKSMFVMNISTAKYHKNVKTTQNNINLIKNHIFSQKPIDNQV